MNDHELRYLALKLQANGTDAMPEVLQMLRSSGLSDLCYAYKIRTKPEEKLCEKVHRKRVKKNPNYELHDITDVVGLRLVALFRAEMVELFERVLAVIIHADAINPNPFKAGVPDEVIIYKGHNAFDEMAPRIREVAMRHCPQLSIKEEQSSEGYSSVHLVARLNSAPRDFPVRDYFLPIEIQIRSVFEDAWGEIDHKFGYTKKSGKDSGKPINNPEFVFAHLKVLKRFSDACMEYADAIRSEAVGLPAALTAPRKVISVPSDRLILERFAALGVDACVVEAYEAARAIKDEASTVADTDQAEARRKYIDAADLFRELANSVCQDDGCLAEDVPGIRLPYYYARMNEALCLLSTNERDQVVAAHSIYQALESHYPDYPLLKMRYGQALGKLGHLEESLEKLRDAGIQAAAIAKECGDGSVESWPDQMPLTDYEHLIRTQPKLLGYHLWLKIVMLGKGSDEEKIDLFRQAYEVTEQGLGAAQGDDRQLFSMHHNLLYYALGQASRIASVPAVAGAESQLRAAIDKHLDYIERRSARRDQLPVAQLDTLMKAYSFLGRGREAVDMAQALLRRCLDESNTELDANERLKCATVAYAVAQGLSIGPID